MFPVFYFTESLRNILMLFAGRKKKEKRFFMVCEKEDRPNDDKLTRNQVISPNHHCSLRNGKRNGIKRMISRGIWNP